jgi:serine protease Do
MGISFAIPIDEATQVAEQIKTSGRVSRGRIGVSIDQVTKEVAESIRLGKPMGALVRSVESGGPAETAGVEPGDIITKFDGRTVEKSGDLPRIVGGVKPGSKAGLQVFRRGAYKDLTVSVAEIEPDRDRRASNERGENGKAAPPVVGTLGIAVSDLSDAQKRELKLKNGVRVETAEGLAARAGLREGDVILTVENTEITSVKQFEAAVGKLDKSKPVTVLVRRGETVNFLIIRPAR